jgi:hypothetical protein
MASEIETAVNTIGAMEKIGVVGILLALVAGFAYIFYKHLLQEHTRILGLFERLTTTIDRLDAKIEKNAVLFDKTIELQAQTSNKAFDLAQRMQENIITTLSEINTKLDRLLEDRAVKTTRGRKEI